MECRADVPSVELSAAKVLRALEEARLRGRRRWLSRTVPARAQVNQVAAVSRSDGSDRLTLFRSGRLSPSPFVRYGATIVRYAFFIVNRRTTIMDRSVLVTPMRQINVKVQSDHLERQVTVPKPILAVTELVWNALDADAMNVRVELRRNQMEGLQSITVLDDGHGISYEDAIPAFENLGGSWKKGPAKSKIGRRILHGKAGKGRFRAFFLGDEVTWKTWFRDNGSVKQFSVQGTRSTLGVFTLSEPVAAKRTQTGTEVRIAEIQRNFPSLDDPRAVQEMAGQLALYLRKYPGVRVSYNGIIIDPAAVQELERDYALGAIELESGRIIEDAHMTVIEWRTLAERSMFLCDANGFALAEAPAGIQAPGFNFTAYLRSDFLRELDQSGALVFEDLDPELRPILETGRSRLKEHFRRRKAELARNVVREWKEQAIYPYEGEPQNILEETERQVFDVVALNVSEYLPDFERADSQSKRFSFRLLRQAIQESPDAVQKIIQEVLDLPSEKRDDLAALLKRTTLTALINASRVVTDRLDFLRGLDMLLFNPISREQLLERSQLHKILEEHTWLFGEEFALSLSDKGLKDVLKKHVQLLGWEEDVDLPVLREDGSIGIVDLMFSRLIPQSKSDEREHLVVELKRPKKIIDSGVYDQIESYATAVAADERFRDTSTRWVFWALSDDIAPNIRMRARQPHKPEGLVLEVPDLRLSVWVKSWGQILESCRARLEFFRRNLEYVADDESAVALLRRLHSKYLPPELAERDPSAAGGG